MSICFINEVEIYELGSHLWQGGLDTYNTLKEHGKLNELDELFNEIFTDELPTINELNDYLWFDRDYIFETCGLTAEGETKVD